MNLTSVTLGPDPPVLGSPAYLNATGVAAESVTNGTVVLDVFLDGIQLYTNSAPTCGSTTITLPLGFGSITINSVPCPTPPASTQNVSVSLILPAGAPSGDYQVIFNSTDQGNAPLYCINASFTL
jgi:hypothetical protein